jgi:hypothetical protein
MHKTGRGIPHLLRKRQNDIVTENYVIQPYRQSLIAILERENRGKVGFLSGYGPLRSLIFIHIKEDGHTIYANENGGEMLHFELLRTGPLNVSLLLGTRYLPKKSVLQ